jgi:hypothetical protein
MRIDGGTVALQQCQAALSAEGAQLGAANPAVAGIRRGLTLRAASTVRRSVMGILRGGGSTAGTSTRRDKRACGPPVARAGPPWHRRFV